jgi:predicted nucleotidyltransferase
MRLSPEQSMCLKEQIHQCLPSAKVYLFGSRAVDKKRGGDIDILIVGERVLALQEKRDIKISFYKKFGEQKIDLVSFENEDPAPFKQIAESEGVLL